MNPAVQSLIDLSRRIGQQIDLVQGGGGNTSVKAEGALYIKASGTPLKNMSADRGWVELGTDNGQRPSMEWPMHQALQAKWVCHTHSVYFNVFGCMQDDAGKIAELMHGLNYVILPYAQPGKVLAAAITALQPQPEIILLKNHGLLIATDTAERALELTELIHQRFAAAVPAPFTVPEAPLAQPKQCFFPDAAVLSTNAAVLAANTYIPAMITQLGYTPKALTPEEVAALRNMEEEQYRIQLNS